MKFAKKKVAKKVCLHRLGQEHLARLKRREERETLEFEVQKEMLGLLRTIIAEAKPFIELAKLEAIGTASSRGELHQLEVERQKLGIQREKLELARLQREVKEEDVQAANEAAGKGVTRVR